MSTFNVSLGEHCGLRQDRGGFPVATSSPAARTTAPGNSTELSRLVQTLAEPLVAKPPPGSAADSRGWRTASSGLLRGWGQGRAGDLAGGGPLPALDATLGHPTRISPSPMQVPASPLHDRGAKADGVTGLVQITRLTVLKPPLTGKVTLGTDPPSRCRERRWRPPSRGGGSREVCVT